MKGFVWMVAALAVGSGLPARLHAQEVVEEPVPLSLEAAVARAVGQSEEVRLARSRLDLAETQITSTRSAALPQISGTLAYTRTFESPFQTGGGPQIPDSLQFRPDTMATLEERVRYLERATPTAGLGGLGTFFGSLPFGRENSYVASISGSQLLYSGGRVGAALDIAQNFRNATRLNLVEEVAELELQARTAYYRALLAQEMEGIAAAALEQAEAFLEQERLRLRAGRVSELEVLRAEVSRDNLRPQLVQARNAAELSMLNLKRLTDIPMEEKVLLTSELEIPPPDEVAPEALRPEVLLAQRAAIRAVEQQLAIREQQVRIAKGAFLPSVSLQMTYGKQLFPSDPFELGGEWRTDWTASLGVQVPIFSGLSRVAGVEKAQVELSQARLQLGQLREAVQLQYRQALGEKERARAAIAARQRTVEVAQRVYDLTLLRYEQGLATQLEVSDARLALLQARTNLAQAITDYYVANAGLTRSLTDADASALPSAPAIPDAQPPAAEPPAPAPTPAKPESVR